MSKNARKRRKMYAPPVHENTRRHDEKLARFSERRAAKERLEGLDPNDAAGRWLAQHDR